MSVAIESMPYGMPITLVFTLANLAQGATTKAALTGGQTQTTSGFIVPTGCVFKPIGISMQGNAAVSAGTVIAKCTDNGTAIANGPECQLDTTNTTALGTLARKDASPAIAAGHIVGVTLIGDGSYAPATNDYDAVLFGVLQPA